MPAVMALSPMTATTLRPSPSRSAATGHAEGRPDGGTGVTDAEDVVLASRQEGVQAVFSGGWCGCDPAGRSGSWG